MPTYIRAQKNGPTCSRTGQVDFPATFLAHLPTGQSPRQATFQSNPKGQAGFQIFSGAGILYQHWGGCQRVEW